MSSYVDSPKKLEQKRDPTALAPPKSKGNRPQTVYRIKHSERFTILDNLSIELLETRAEVLGFWTWCMKHPDDYQFDRGAVRRALGVGRNKLTQWIRYLEGVHLARRRRVRDFQNRFAGVELVIFETPQLAELADRQPELFGKSDWDPLPPVAQNQVDGSNLFDNSIRDTSATGRNGDTARRQAIDRNPGDGDLSPNSHHSLASQPDSQRPGSRRTAGQRPENRPVKQVQTEQGPTQLNTILNKDQGGCAAGAGCASEAGPIDPAMSDHEMSRFLIRLLIDRRIGFDPRTVEGILREHKRSPEYVLKTICLCLVQQSHVPNKCGWIRKLLKEGNANFKPLAEAMGDIALEKLIATLNDWLSKSQGQPNLHLLNVPQSIDSAANKARQLRALKDAEASEQSRPRSPSVITHAPPGGPQFIGARRPLPEVFPE